MSAPQKSHEIAITATRLVVEEGLVSRQASNVGWPVSDDLAGQGAKRGALKPDAQGHAERGDLAQLLKRMQDAQT